MTSNTSFNKNQIKALHSFLKLNKKCSGMLACVNFNDGYACVTDSIMAIRIKVATKETFSVPASVIEFCYKNTKICAEFYIEGKESYAKCDGCSTMFFDSEYTNIHFNKIFGDDFSWINPEFGTMAETPRVFNASEMSKFLAFAQTWEGNKDVNITILNSESVTRPYRMRVYKGIEPIDVNDIECIIMPVRADR